MNRIALLAALAPTLVHSAALCAVDAPEPGDAACDDAACQHHGDGAIRPIAQALFQTLPPEEQAKLTALGAIGAPAQSVPMGDIDASGSAAEWLDSYLEEVGENEIEAEKLKALRSLASALDSGATVPEMCFAPGTDPEYVVAVTQMIHSFSPIAFQQSNRWATTVLSGSGLGQGDPTILTYSFVPDGTFINDAGFGTGNSLLFAWLDSIYGEDEWQELFERVFGRWAELCGTSYVFEPNDDGVPLFSTVGQQGVRGDVRIAAMPLDGNSGVLAFNFFPDFGGDMVFDAFDSFFNSTAGDFNRFRNVTSHEHGHGIGMFHVCPINESKLMEPFYSGAFDGPQLDDILNGQRHYGDPYEHNDTAATATLVGGLDTITTMTVIDTASIDSNSDVDWYAITAIEPLTLAITVEPDADSYPQSAQNPEDGSCFPGEETNYNNRQNLRVAIYHADDIFNPIEVADSAFFGGTETLDIGLENAGDYLIKVDGSFPVPSGPDEIQLYKMTLETSDAPFLVPQIVVEAPSIVDPITPVDVTATIFPREDTIMAGPFIHTRVNGGSFTMTEMTPVLAQEFSATLPPLTCSDTLEYYFSVVGATSGEITLPLDGNAMPFVANAGNIILEFSDNFQTDAGWTVQGDLLTQLEGRWERGVPAGSGMRGDPFEDGDGSGACYVTGNGGPGSNTDVELGETILVSPVFDLSDVISPTVTYWRWYDNTGSGLGSAPDEDRLVVEVTDGSVDDGELVWFLLETVGPDTEDSKGGWNQVTFDLETDVIGSGFDPESSSFQIRFVASDVLNNSVVEAGIDGFEIRSAFCPQLEPVISLAGPQASVVAPGEPYTVNVTITEAFDQLDEENPPYLEYTVAGLETATMELVHNGGDSYTGTIPGLNCIPEEYQAPGMFDVTYYVIATGELTGETVFPGVMDDITGYNIGVENIIADDNFNADTGWTVTGTAASAAQGRWQRGTPAGNGANGDPTADSDGSGQCFVTGNAGGASDVDGQTILVSPLFDVSGQSRVAMRFDHWYDNSAGGTQAGSEDEMIVQIQLNGTGGFSTITSIGPDQGDPIGQWNTTTLELSSILNDAGSFRVRFVVSDLQTDSTIEAGIDSVVVRSESCTSLCPADLNDDGVLDFFDLSIFLGEQIDWDGNTQFDFFDLSGFLNDFAAGCGSDEPK